MIKKIKAVIFDLDGVLIDTEGSHRNSWIDALNMAGIKERNFDYGEYIGMDGIEIEKILLEKYNLINSKLLLNKNRVLKDKYFKKIKLFRDSKSLLMLLKRKKILLAVASNSSNEELNFKLKISKLGPLLDIKVSKEEVNNPKPFPDIYLKAIEKLRIKPHECIAVEDTETGLKSATSAGIKTILITGKFSNIKCAKKAEKILPNLSKLKDYLCRNYLFK